MELVNIFAWRSTDSWALFDVAGPVGAGNAEAVCAAAAEADLVVAAWGMHGALAGRGRRYGNSGREVLETCVFGG